MKKKIIIEDLVSDMKGIKEKELPVDTTIRFELQGDSGFKKYSICFDAHDNGIEIRCLMADGKDTDVIRLKPDCSNKIILY